jgi:hypothetical protein
MDNDDRQIGRILNRREALLLLGGLGIGAAALATRGRVPSEWVAPAFAQTMAQTLAPMCVVRPELTEGPYFVAHQMNRSDIRSEPSDGSLREGVPLGIAMPRVSTRVSTTPHLAAVPSARNSCAAIS